MADEDLSERRRRLKAAIDERDAEAAAQAERDNRASSSMSGYAAAFRLSTEFISAVVVGGLLGFGLDYAFGTMPLFLIVLLMLGFAAGVLNVLRSAGLISQPQAGKRPEN